MILWRPVGLAEMQLIYEAGMRAYPPRLPSQPIFYPVLYEEYATKISRNWNATEAPFAGYVTRSEVADDFARDYPPRIVGSRDDAELWIPAEDLDRFNAALIGRVTVVSAHFGARFRGQVSIEGELAGQDAIRQIGTLAAASALGSLEACLGSPGCKLAVFLHLPFWSVCSAEVAGLSQFALRDLLESLRQWWSVEGSGVALPEHTEWLPPVNR